MTPSPEVAPVPAVPAAPAATVTDLDQLLAKLAEPEARYQGTLDTTEDEGVTAVELVAIRSQTPYGTAYFNTATGRLEMVSSGGEFRMLSLAALLKEL